MSRSDDGHLHDPADFDDDGEGVENEGGTDGGAEASEEWVDDPVHPEAADREFGRRGWVLVGVIVVAFIVSPLAIVLWPPDLHYFVALLILPLFPAFVLAVTAIWATTRP